MTEIDGVLAAWQPYVEAIDDWQYLVKGLEPIPTGCGPVYELGQPLEDRVPEEFAIADMRDILFGEPHYHANGETEIYIVLSGLGTVVVGGKENKVKKGSVVVTPPNTSHFTIPRRDLVLALINVPTFSRDNYISLNQTNDEVAFESTQLADMIEGIYRGRGLVVERGKDEPATVYEPHKHEKTHLFTVSGSIDIKLGDKPAQTISPFQEIVVGSNVVHEAVVGPDGWEYIAAWDEKEAQSFTH